MSRIYDTLRAKTESELSFMIRANMVRGYKLAFRGPLMAQMYLEI